MANILLVEDRMNQRLLYQMELEDEGYKVVPVSNGPEALRQVREEDLDLVVFDPCLPGIQEKKALENLSGLQEVGLPVVVYSACDTFRQKPIPCVADACLTKSSNLDPLKRQIEYLLVKQAEGKPDSNRCQER